MAAKETDWGTAMTPTVSPDMMSACKHHHDTHQDELMFALEQQLCSISLPASIVVSFPKCDKALSAL